MSGRIGFHFKRTPVMARIQGYPSVLWAELGYMDAYK